MTLDEIMNNFCTDKIYTTDYEIKTDLEWDCPEHYMPQDAPIVPKTYKTTILQHKQNKPIVKTTVKYVDIND